MNLNTAFEKLFTKHGSHSAAASAIGYTTEHYRAIRNGRVKVSQRVAQYIILKAAELSPVPAAAPGAACAIQMLGLRKKVAKEMDDVLSRVQDKDKGAE